MCQLVCQRRAGDAKRMRHRAVCCGKVVSQIFTSWNQMVNWLRQLQGSDEPHSQARRELTNHFQLIGGRSSVRRSRLLNTAALRGTSGPVV